MLSHVRDHALYHEQVVEAALALLSGSLWRGNVPRSATPYLHDHNGRNEICASDVLCVQYVFPVYTAADSGLCIPLLMPFRSFVLGFYHIGFDHARAAASSTEPSTLCFDINSLHTGRGLRVDQWSYMYPDGSMYRTVCFFSQCCANSDTGVDLYIPRP